MGKIVIELDEKVNLQIKAKTLEEAIRKLIKQANLTDKFRSIRLKTKDFRFNREEAESR